LIVKRSSIVLLSAILSTGFASMASAETKIGVVDIQRLASDSPQAKEANDALRAEFGPRQKGIETQQQTLKAKEDKLTKDGATMTEVQRTQADKELRDGYRDLQLKQSAFQEDLNAARQDAQDKISRVLRDEVIVFAKAQGFDLILTDAAYATTALDVTPQLLQSMLARKGAPAAAPVAAAPPAANKPPASIAR
jgi:outer membrane protein